EIVGRLVPDPAHLFAGIKVIEFVAPGDLAVQLTVDAGNLWFKTLAANYHPLSSADVLLPHAGRLVVRSGYPRSGCSTMLVSSQASYFLSTAVCVEPHPADASKTLVSRFLAAPVDVAHFRVKHLARMSVARAGTEWFRWLFDGDMCTAREAMKGFYVVLSLQDCSFGGPLLPRVAGAEPFDAETWERVGADVSFAAYLQSFLHLLDLGAAKVFSSLDGQQLVPSQAILRRKDWEHVRPVLLPVFQKACIAYRRLLPNGTVELPKLAENVPATFSHVCDG
ncbi:CHMP3, partial [Symbiodinium pilosum]